MIKEVYAPPGGESVTEATVAKINFNVGDFVEKDDELLELETDKAGQVVSSPASGIIKEIKVKADEVVAVGALLLTIDETASKPLETSKEKLTEKTSAIEKENSDEKIIKNDDIRMSPVASQIINKNSLSTNNIQGTGLNNMITKKDAMESLDNKENSKSSSNTADSYSNKGIIGLEEVRIVKMSNLRRTIARRLKEAQNTAAILTTFNEVDMSRVMEIRKKYQEDFQKKHGIKLGFMSFFAKASALALQEIPTVNAQIDGDNIIYKNYCHISVAIGTEKGLVVPVIRYCDKLSFNQIEKEVLNYAQKANSGKLLPADFIGGTFTISNGGTYGSMMSTPIINPPQSAILGMHSIIERPIAVNGQIVIKPMMYLALSYDHRIIDGKEAVTFLVKIKNYIENPEKMLLEC